MRPARVGHVRFVGVALDHVAGRHGQGMRNCQPLQGWVRTCPGERHSPRGPRDRSPRVHRRTLRPSYRSIRLLVSRADLRFTGQEPHYTRLRSYSTRRVKRLCGITLRRYGVSAAVTDFPPLTPLVACRNLQRLDSRWIPLRRNRHGSLVHPRGKTVFGVRRLRPEGVRRRGWWWCGHDGGGVMSLRPRKSRGSPRCAVRRSTCARNIYESRQCRPGHH
jgi:hypothetical protein